MTTIIDGPAKTLERDRYGRPLIVPPGGGEPVPYTRASTIADTLDDRYNLEQWKLRQVAVGLSRRPDLLALAAAEADDKAALNRVCADAMDAAEAGAAANYGTALHAFFDQLNKGGEPEHVPAALRSDVEAYRDVMRRFVVVTSETFVVDDVLKVAGTFDILAWDLEAGRLRIIDNKTGAGAVTYGQQSIAVQLAAYAGGVRYDVATGERSPLYWESDDGTAHAVDRETAVVIHLPAGTGQCVVHDVDITAGREALEHSVWARDWRKRRDLFTARAALRVAPVVEPEPEPPAAAPLSPTLRIAAAKSLRALRELWSEFAEEGIDPTSHRKAFDARIDQLKTS